MTDLEITRLCAEASEVWKDAHKWYPTWTMDATFSGIRCTDNEVYIVPNNFMRQDPRLYDPLHDDAQAMALETWLLSQGIGFSVSPYHISYYWQSSSVEVYRMTADMTNLNNRRRAICECVAKMQAAKDM